MSTFQERLSNLKKRIEGNLTPAYNKILTSAIRELETPVIRNKVLKPGDNMPEFELLDQDGNTICATELLKDGPLVITFYRGFWCPYCNIDMNNLQNYVPEIEDLGAKLIAISPEKPDYSKRIIKRQNLTFNILHDKRNEVADSFGLKWVLSDEMISFYQEKLHYNLKVFHGDDDWTLPIPARFLIDTSGVIRYAESTPDYSIRPDPDDLMLVLKTI